MAKSAFLESLVPALEKYLSIAKSQSLKFSFGLPLKIGINFLAATNSDAMTLEKAGLSVVCIISLMRSLAH